MIYWKIEAPTPLIPALKGGEYDLMWFLSRNSAQKPRKETSKNTLLWNRAILNHDNEILHKGKPGTHSNARISYPTDRSNPPLP